MYCSCVFSLIATYCDRRWKYDRLLTIQEIKKNSHSYCAVIWRYLASQCWLRVFLQQTWYFSVLIQWLQVGSNASLEIRTVQPSEQLKCYQMATTQGNCFKIQKTSVSHLWIHWDISFASNKNMSLKTSHGLLVAQGIELDYYLWAVCYQVISITLKGCNTMVIFQQFETSPENLNSILHINVSNHSKLPTACRVPVSWSIFCCVRYWFFKTVIYQGR